MKSSSLSLRASFGLALLSLAAGCTGSERFPPVEVGATRPNGDVLVGRVRDGQAPPIDRVDEAVGYAAAANPGAEEPMTALSPMTGEGAVYAADLPATMNGNRDEEPKIASASMVVPQHGVNMDAGLGIGGAAGADYAADSSGRGVQPQIVTDTGAMAIAEGATSQPVVDGIGFDDPVQVAASAPEGADGAGEGLTSSMDQGLGEGEGQILPLSVDSGNSGMETRPMARRRPQADCSLYLDKRNCPQG